MSENLQRISNLLQELIDIHRQLVNYGNAKTEFLRSNAVESISYISGKEKELVQRVQELEQYRTILVGRFAIEHKIRSQRKIGMDIIVQTVTHPEEKRQLMIKRDELSAAVKELQDVNELNQTLVRLALEYVHFSQDLLFGPEEDDVTYHRAIQGITKKRGSQFNMKL